MAKYRIWDCGKLTPAFTRRPRDSRARKIGSRTIEEIRLGIRWYIPVTAADYSPAEYEGRPAAFAKATTPKKGA